MNNVRLKNEVKYPKTRKMGYNTHFSFKTATLNLINNCTILIL